MITFNPKGQWLWMQTHHNTETSGTLDQCFTDLSSFFPDLANMALARSECLETGWAIGDGWTICAKKLQRYPWEDAL